MKTDRKAKRFLLKTYTNMPGPAGELQHFPHSLILGRGPGVGKGKGQKGEG